MLNIEYISNKFNKILFTAIVLNLAFGWTNLATAEKVKKVRVTDSDFGLPTHRRDGGSRGSRDNCVANAEKQNLIALIPETTVAIDTSASPKLFFYVPKMSDRKTLEFVLRNEQDELMYEAFLSTGGNGIMSVEIPADLQANLLATKQNQYHWYLSMICNNRHRSRDIVVEGWIYQEEIDMATKKQLETASTVERAEVYRDRGFWYDALSILAENDSLAEQPLVREKWTQMLESIGLEQLAFQPFIETQLLETPQ